MEDTHYRGLGGKNKDIVKLRTKFLIILFVVVVICSLSLAAAFFLKAKKPPVKEGRDIVKQFTFSSSGELKEFEGKLLAHNWTDYKVANEGGKSFLKATSNDSASALYYKRNFVTERRPFVSWDWKAIDFPDRKQKEALDEKKEFDFVAQFYVIFSARFFLNAKAIQYVWTENLPVGTVSDSPYTKNVKLLVLESGPSEEWKHEERNIAEDYYKLFGEELEKDIAAIAFMTDSDSTETDSAAYISNITIGYLGGIPKEEKQRPKKALKRSKRFPFRKIKEPVEEKPPEIEEKPVEIEEKAPEVEKKPPDVEEKPPVVEEKPIEIEKKPIEAEEKPIEAEEKPIEEKPSDIKTE